MQHWAFPGDRTGPRLLALVHEAATHAQLVGLSVFLGFSIMALYNPEDLLSSSDPQI